MELEAKNILAVFRARGLRGGHVIHPAEFGDAIVWENGYIRDEPVRIALGRLLDGGYLLEHNAALELTERGELYLYSV